VTRHERPIVKLFGLVDGPELSIEKLKELVFEAGADINSADEFGTTILMRAALGGDSDFVKTLLEKASQIGCSERVVNATNQNGWTTLMFAAEANLQNSDIINFLLEDGANASINNSFFDSQRMMRNIKDAIINKISQSDGNKDNFSNYKSLLSFLNSAEKTQKREILQNIFKATAEFPIHPETIKERKSKLANIAYIYEQEELFNSLGIGKIRNQNSNTINQRLSNYFTPGKRYDISESVKKIKLIKDEFADRISDVAFNKILEKLHSESGVGELLDRNSEIIKYKLINSTERGLEANANKALRYLSDNISSFAFDPKKITGQKDDHEQLKEKLSSTIYPDEEHKLAKKLLLTIYPGKYRLKNGEIKDIAINEGLEAAGGGGSLPREGKVAGGGSLPHEGNAAGGGGGGGSLSHEGEAAGDRRPQNRARNEGVAAGRPGTTVINATSSQAGSQEMAQGAVRE
jgi:hypothetical protein